MTLPNRQPTIADVAQKAGVSIATVSRVLNRTAPVTEETTQRVQTAIEELNYRPRSAARVLASRKTYTIGLLLPEISGPFFSPMMRGIEAGAAEAGFDLLVHTTNVPRPEGTPHRPLGEHNTDGLIVFTDSLDTKELTRLHRIGFPLVLLHQPSPESLDIPTITVENKSGTEKLISHLIEVHGKRQIAFLRGPDTHMDSTWRERGYLQALKTHNLSFDPTLMAYGGFNEQIAFAAAKQLMGEGVMFDAIFTGDDESAVGVLSALRQANKRVPEDVAVVGFDDVPFSSYLTPPLTTVRVPIEQVGSEAVHQLICLIRGGQVDLEVLLPTELVIRQSCGCQTT
ncbi:MAG: LacI family DNA-binding transcriptional regulator [Chloroflexota bacterium]